MKCFQLLVVICRIIYICLNSIHGLCSYCEMIQIEDIDDCTGAITLSWKHIDGSIQVNPGRLVAIAL